MQNVRNARLRSDHDRLQALVKGSEGSITIDSQKGTPPQTYVLSYKCKGIERLNGDKPVYRNLHRVQIQFGASYPAQQPTVTMLTPIFHPHVFTHNAVCLGRRWTPSEYLDNLVLRIGSIIQYEPQYIDFASPANSTAASWARSHMNMFPIDRCTFKGSQSSNEGGIQWTNLT